MMRLCQGNRKVDARMAHATKTFRRCAFSGAFGGERPHRPAEEGTRRYLTRWVEEVSRPWTCLEKRCGGWPSTLRSPWRLCAPLLLTLSFSAAVFAQVPTDARANLTTAADAGDLALRDFVNRAGDEVVLEALAAASPLHVRLAATRACPALDAPELCVDRLVAELLGRDPDLAPAAAAALGAITESLSADDLARREASVTPLLRAADALDAAMEDGRLRADLRRMAGRSAAQLRAATTDGGP